MFSLLFSMNGRISRGSWWLGHLVQWAAVIPVGYSLYEAAALRYLLPNLMFIAVTILIFMWSTFCLSAKRLHDRGKSAWFYLMILVPVGQIWHFIECGCLPGDPDTNAYGPPPGSGVATKWKAPDDTLSSADIDRLIAKAKAARQREATAAVPAMGGPIRGPTIAPIFGRRR